MKFKSFIILFLFCFILPFITATSMIGNIPDVCLPKNVSFYDIWLEDYYSIDLDEVINITFLDPLLNNTATLFENHATLNTECFELAYYFVSRDDVSPLTDILRIQTLDDDCSVNFSLNFLSPNLDQTFNLRVTDNCDGNQEVEPIYYNVSEYVFNDIISYYTFDDTLIDSVYNFSVYSSGTPTYSTNAVTGKAIKLESATDHILLNDTFDYISDNTYSLSFWFTSPSNAGLTTMIECDSSIQPSARFVVSNDLCLGVDSGSCNTGNATSLKNGSYHHVVFSNNGDNWTIYVDSLEVQHYDSSSIPINDCYFGGVAGNNYADTYVDDVGIWDRGINQTEIDYLYNNGYGRYITEIDAPNLPNSTSLPDVYLNGTSNISIDLSLYFGNWEDMFLTVPDPWDNDLYRIYTGYSTLNTDYYEATLYANGTVFLESYERPYSFLVGVSACNYTPYEECINESFNVIIQSNLSDVVLLNPFEAYYNLGFYGSKTFSANYFFQYHDNVVLSYPESNFSGVLNTSFPFLYSEIDNPSNNASFMVFINCSIGQTLETINVLGDLNITLECGEEQAYYTISAYNNYNQVVSMYASNNNSWLSESFTVLSGNPDLPSGYMPANYDLESEPNIFNKYIGAFSNILPADLEYSARSKVVFFILFIVVLLLFTMFYKSSVVLAVWLSLFSSIILLFFFASVDYVRLIYPMMLLFGCIFYLGIKLLRGGI